MNSQVPLFPDVATNDRPSFSSQKPTTSQPSTGKSTNDFADSMREAEKQVKAESEDSHAIKSPASKQSDIQKETPTNSSESATVDDTSQANSAIEEQSTELSVNQQVMQNTAGLTQPIATTDDILSEQGQWLFSPVKDSAKLSGADISIETLPLGTNEANEVEVQAFLSGNSVPQTVQGQPQAQVITAEEILTPVLPGELAKAAMQSTQANVDPEAEALVSSNKFNSLNTTTSMSANLQQSSLNLDKQLVQQAVNQASAIDSNATQISTELQQSSLSTHNLTATTTPTKPQLLVNTPFQQAQWGQSVAEKVVWMNNQGIQEAEIHMDPPELGPLQVKVSVTNDQAQVSFVVQHATVKESLDQSAMRLREMFEGEGLDLVNVDVSDQSQQQADDENTSSSESTLLVEGDEVIAETPLSEHQDGYSLVDDYV